MAASNIGDDDDGDMAAVFVLLGSDDSCAGYRNHRIIFSLPLLFMHCAKGGWESVVQSDTGSRVPESMLWVPGPGVAVSDTIKGMLDSG